MSEPKNLFSLFLLGVIMSKTKNTIRHDKLDSRKFNKMKNKVKDLQNITEEGEDQLETVDKLTEDVFYSLYKYKPKENPEQEIEEPYRYNKDLIDKLKDMKDFKQLRSHTKMDDFQSSLSTVSFTNRIIEEMDDEDLQEINRKIKDMRERVKKIDDLASELDKLIGQMKEEDIDLSDDIEELEEELEELEKLQEEDMEKLEEDMDMNTPSSRDAVRSAVREAKSESEAMGELMNGFSMDSGDIESLSWKDKMELAKKLKDTEWLHDLAIEIGKMKRLAEGVRRNKINKMPEEVMGIKRDRNISRALPSELGYLCNDLEDLFWKKYTEDDILEYELEGQEDEGEGPIIACVDTSGSMRGRKMRWAKAVAFALYNIAQRDDRPFYGINFASSDELAKFDLNEEDEGERYKVMMDFISHSFGNGTDFNRPLTEASDIIEEKEDYEEADIVFMTDGRAQTSESVLERIERLKDELDFRIVGIQIGYKAGGLEAFADNIYDFRDIEKWGDNTAEDIFQLV